MQIGLLGGVAGADHGMNDALRGQAFDHAGQGRQGAFVDHGQQPASLRRPLQA